MERHIDEELEQIRDKLLLMGGKVEEMIRSANAALVQRDETFIARVKELEKEVDQLELEIDEDCLTLLARQQPMATDLRFLVAVMKITNDLERIGDVAHGIAKLVKPLNQEPPLKPYIDLPRMAEDASSMVRDCLDALVKQDGALAREVIGRDEKVDEIYKQLSRELFTFMIEDPGNVTRSLQLLLIARNLERIADHATNISEDVIYYVEGRDVRHTKVEAS